MIKGKKNKQPSVYFLSDHQRASKNCSSAYLGCNNWLWIWVAVVLLAYQLEAVCPFYNDLWYQQGSFTQRNATYWIFPLLQIILCTPQCFWNTRTSTSGMNNHILFFITQIIPLRQSDAPFELQHVVSTICRGLLTRYLGKQLKRYA